MRKAGFGLSVLVAALIVLPVLAGTTLTFTTSDPAAVIPDASAGAFTACQNITVAAMPTTITDVTVQVSVGHSWVGDLTARLTSPSASVLMLVNRPVRVGTGFGDSSNLAAATPITYSDTAASTLSAETMGAPAACGDTSIIGSTAACLADNFIPAPDAADTPIPGVGTNLAQYDGANPNGVWQLCIADSAGGDTGTLSSWSITVTSTPVELQSFTIE